MEWMVNQEQMAPLVLEERVEQLVKMVPLVPLAHQVHVVRRVMLENKAYLVLMVHKVNLDKEENLEQ